MARPLRIEYENAFYHITAKKLAPTECKCKGKVKSARQA